MKMMPLFDIKKLVLIGSIAFTFLVVGGSDVAAQSRREIERERQRVERAQRRAEQQRQPRAGSYNRMMDYANNAHFNQGYEQGRIAGEWDRRKRKYNQSNVHRNTGSAPYAGDPTSLDYIFRQGYLQGYNDGYNGRPY
jgi:hypothetical protein